MATVTGELLQLQQTIIGLRQAVDLLVAAQGGGQIDPTAIQQQITAAAQAAIDAVLAQVQDLDLTVVTGRTDMLRQLLGLQNAYGGDRFAYELFTTDYTLADTVAIPGVSTVAGDDSVDISSTALVVTGREYIIDSGAGAVAITAGEVFSATRFKATAPIQVSVVGATLRRTNWTMGSGQAAAGNGRVYLSRPLDLGVVDADKALVVRRGDNDAALSVLFRDATHAAWTSAPLTEARPAVAVALGASLAFEADWVDAEYRVPARGPFELMLIAAHGASHHDLVVRHMVAVQARSGTLGGGASPPDDAVIDGGSFDEPPPSPAVEVIDGGTF